MGPSDRSRRRIASARWWGAGVLAFAVTSAVSRSGSAGGGAATDAYEGVRVRATLDVHGLLDFYGQHDFGWHPSGTVQLRAFDVKSEVPSLNFARLSLAHRPDVVGFRLDVGVGDTADAYLRSDPAASTHPRLSRALSYVEQAFVTAELPVGRGVSIDVGKFGTPLGLEDNETPRNWSYSRSLLYTWAEPAAHTGVRLTFPASETLAVSAFWLNGWDTNVAEGNGMRSFAAAASWRPVPRLDLSAVYMVGPERDLGRLADPALALRHELDAFATCSPARHVSLAFTADYGRDAARGGVSWWGLGGYVRYQPLVWLAGTLRGEHYADPDGFTTGARQRLAEFTGTIELRGTVSDVTVIGRLEYRRDQSDAPVFEATSPPRATHQDTLGLGVTALF
jgi:hypothetical protein